MSQPVKLSDGLVLEARRAAEVQVRSIAGQVEFWARLGRSLELLLDGKKVLELGRRSGSKSLSELLDVVETPKGREMFKAYLESEPYPHYEAHPADSNLLVRIDEDGTRTAGHFVHRAFVPASQPEVKPGDFAPGGQARRIAGFVSSREGEAISKKAERRTRIKP
jgi:hypothetical protein